MDIKDQRLEMRVSQQHLDDLDEIRHSLDSSYIPSRSDIARTFISNGIESFKRGGDESPESLPLGERLSLFFQIEQYEVANGDRSRSSNEITQVDIIKNVYLRGFFWFFELDGKALGKLGVGQSYQVLALLNRVPNAQTIQSLNYVCEVLDMFGKIEDCMNGCGDYGDATNMIRKLSENKSVPLEFSGFEGSSVQLNEMAALVLWLKAGDRRRSPSTVGRKKYDSEVYTRLLTVYREYIKGTSRLTMDVLQDIMLDRSLG